MNTFPAYQQTPGDTVVFGYLNEYVPENLVPDIHGSSKFYSSDEVYELMTKMDAGIIGMQQQAFGKIEGARQLVPFVVLTRLGDNGLEVAVYRHPGLSDREDPSYLTFGFKGQVDRSLAVPHLAVNGENNQEPSLVISSYYSALYAGMRALDTGVDISLISEEPTESRATMVAGGFISNYRPQDIGYIGNTHLGVVFSLPVGKDIEFKVTGDGCETIGWQTKQEIFENAGEFEEWARLCLPLLDELERTALVAASAP